SRADFSGAFGRELRVRFETRDLNDVLPVLGVSAASAPVKLENGALTFDGTVSGKFEDPRIAGHLALSRFSLAGRVLDSLDAAAAASPAGVELSNASVTRGSLRAQFQGALGLSDWKADDNSAISVKGNIRNAAMADLAPLLELPAGTILPTGMLSGSAEVGGT